MIASPPKGYRPCVGLALFNAQGLVFIGRRANRSLREHVAEGHEWQMPQGGIDAGETPLQAARRELQEETNVTSATLLAEAPGWLSYDLPVDIGKEAWRGAGAARHRNGLPSASVARRTRSTRSPPPAATRPSLTPGAGRRWSERLT